MKKTMIVIYTHGNETPPEAWEELATHIGNPIAMRKGVRFVETDLNRSFTEKALQDPQTYEEWRAVLLKEASLEYDEVLDIHTTTSPYSPYLTAIVTREDMVAPAKKFHPGAIVIMGGPNYSLIGAVKKGICLEFSPQKEPMKADDSPVYRMVSFVDALDGWRDFVPVDVNGETLYPFLVGEEEYKGKCFLCALVTS